MGSSIHIDEIKRYEITEVYTHPDAKVDIVLVHGLNGSPVKTWASKSGTFWPTQLLPTSLKSAQARVLVYGYNADVYSFGGGRGPSSDMIHQHAQTLLSNLALERKSEEASEHPIIWVAHSLGGILVKRALELSFDLQGKNADDLRSIYVSTYGIIFLGTPHNGADIAKFAMILQRMVDTMVPRRLLESHSQLVKTLQASNETLQNINLKFLEIYSNRFKVCMVHEGHPTDMKGTKTLIVDQASASPHLPDVQYFGIEATHSGMCKFESKNSPGYFSISVTLKSWVQESVSVVQHYWELERVQRQQILQAQADSIMGIYTTPQSPKPLLRLPRKVGSPDPSSSVDRSTIDIRSVVDIAPEDSDHDQTYIVKPPGFRPNSIFVGRQEELILLHKMLFDKEKRAEGTSAVLIQSLPGGGKSHLAREYVYGHRDAFPGGIFWICAKSESEIAAGFWDIARKAALKHITDLEKDETLEGSKRFIGMVRNWLNNRHDWLIVFDGIHFDDAEALRKYLPDSRDTSLIYTSTEKSIAGDYHFMNPNIIKLPSLTAVEAQRLLLIELDRQEPFTQADLKDAMQVVQSIEFLPLVIHVVAQRLKATREPLSKFARTNAGKPRLRGLESYTAVVEKLEDIHADEALNLMRVLCFFSQHIPVEMIRLGVRAFDVPVKAVEHDTGRNLNNTFKILNSFALIDRNEPEMTFEASQSSQWSRDLLADNVDVIRIHNVVQAFFVDTLESQGKLPTWLSLAARVFCASYEHANERITRKTHAGLVEDYRLYEIHGIKLQDQLKKSLANTHHYPHTIKALQEAKDNVDQQLVLITSQIQTRTPTSTQDLANRGSDVLLTSIFDRTSSSSDNSDISNRYKFSSRHSSWDMEEDKVQLKSSAKSSARNYLRWNMPFPPPKDEDAGYESDREEGRSTAPMIQQSQRTLKGDRFRLASSESGRYRRTNQYDGFPKHRTVKELESRRYCDRVGAYRAAGAVDPRYKTQCISVPLNTIAHGTLENSAMRNQSHGSNAVASLEQMNRAPVAAAIAEDTTQDDRLSSPHGISRSRMTAGVVTYAPPSPGFIQNISAGYGDVSNISSKYWLDSNAGISPLDQRPSPAEEHLRRLGDVGSGYFVHDNSSARQSSPQSHQRKTQLPYPLTPYAQPGVRNTSELGFFRMPDQHNQDGLALKPESNYHAARDDEGVECGSYDSTVSALHLSGFSNSLPAISPISHFKPTETAVPFTRSNSLDIRLQHENLNASVTPYYPGLPDLSNTQPFNIAHGYTSQPITRDASGQSHRSYHSVPPSFVLEGRRPSFAVTEPDPQLPNFSPKIAPTSYQVYEQVRERSTLQQNIDSESRDERAAVAILDQNKSPRLEFARAALIESFEDWSGSGTPPPRRDVDENGNSNRDLPSPKRLQSQKSRLPFNPSAPSFIPFNSSLPHSRIEPTNPVYTKLMTPSQPPSSPYPAQLPHYATISFQPITLSVPTYAPIASSMNVQSLSSPIPNSVSQSTVAMQLGGLRRSVSAMPASASMEHTASISNGESGSGGLRIGNGLIEFGDFSEPADWLRAQERAEGKK